MLCQECQSRSICQSACPELQLYLKEVEKHQRELLTEIPWHGKFPLPKKRVRLTKREQQIVTLFADGKLYHEIAQILNITKVNARNIFARIKKKR